MLTTGQPPVAATMPVIVATNAALGRLAMSTLRSVSSAALPAVVLDSCAQTYSYYALVFTHVNAFCNLRLCLSDGCPTLTTVTVSCGELELPDTNHASVVLTLEQLLP